MNEAEEAVIRVENLSATSFQVRIEEWEYNDANSMMKHVMSGKCLTAERDGETVTAKPCSQLESQKWIWEPVIIK